MKQRKRLSGEEGTGRGEVAETKRAAANRESRVDPAREDPERQWAAAAPAVPLPLPEESIGE